MKKTQWRCLLASVCVAISLTGSAQAGGSYRLRGVVSDPADWEECPTYGLYYVPMAAGEKFQPVVTDGRAFNSALSGFDLNGEFYVHAKNGAQYKIYAVNTTTGEKTFDMGDWGQTLPLDIVPDRSTGTVYGLCVPQNAYTYGNINEGSYTLCDIEYTPYGVSYNTKHRLTGKFNAFAGDGIDYYLIKTVEEGTEVTGAKLCSLDMQTGNVTELYDLDATPLSYGSATIHPGTGEIYWMVNNGSGNPGQIYRINPADGSMTLVHTISGCQQVVAIDFVDAAALAAPGAVSDLAAVFENGSLSGKVTFTAPVSNRDGSKGPSLTYTLADNISGKTLATGTCNYDEAVEVPLTVEAEASYGLTVTVADGDKESQPVTLKRYIGKDTPGTPWYGATQFSPDGSVTLSWTSVTGGLNGGYIDPAEVTYRVVRYPDEYVVCDGTKDTQVSDVLPVAGRFTIYYYGLSASCDGKTSPERESAKTSSGYLEPPYENTFEDDDDMLGYSTYSANRSDYEWDLYPLGGVSVGGDQYSPMDQWLFTPPMKLETGKNYLIEIHAHNNGNRNETYELRYGSKPSSRDMPGVLGSAEVKSSSSFTADVARFWLSPTEDGSCYLAIRGTSPAGFGRLHIDKFILSDGVPDKAPGAFTDVAVQRDIKGDYKATISFRAPATTFDGSALDAISKVIVTRDGKTIETFTDVTPGQQLSCDDNYLETFGTYMYKLQAFGTGGAGSITESEPTFVGMLKPGHPTWITVVEIEPGKVTVAWEPVSKDVEGNPIDPARVCYRVVSENADVNYFVDNYEGTSATFQAIESGAAPRFMSFRVISITESGWGPVQTVSATLPVGEVLDGFTESFANGRYATTPHASMRADVQSGSADWSLYSDMPDIQSQDGDNGFAAMQAQSVGTQASLGTLKVRVPDRLPGLRFHVYHSGNGTDRNINTVAVDVADITDGMADATWTEIYSTVVADVAPLYQWGECTADLTPYAGKTVIARVRGIANLYPILAIDNIRIGADLVSSVIETPVDQVRVIATDGAITIAGAAGRPVSICTLDGRTVYTDATAGSDALSVSLASGVYVVAVADKAYKIVVF